MSIFRRAGIWAAVAGVRHPVRTAACLLIAGALAVLLLASQEQFDSEILELLPADIPAVRGLKIYQHDFAQAREIAFFFESPEDVDLTGEFRSFFAAELAQQPWVVRWIDSAPTEMPGGRETLVAFAVPLLLKQPPAGLAAQLNGLEAPVLQERLQRLGHLARAGSPLAAFELTWDPLGLLAPLSAELAETISLDEGFSLTSPDGSAQIFSVITNQPSLDAGDCIEMMRMVRAFVEKVRADFGDGAPEVLITGRSAYVEEIAASMRRDIMLTSIVSGIGISILFLIAFGSLRSLAGLFGILVLSALLAMAAGLLLFPALNMIALAFCSILFGLGVDFGFLLLEKIRRSEPGTDRFSVVADAVERRLPGISGVALTTAIGFLALTFGESPGFTQLGVLTAAGILFCAILLPLGLFVAVPKSQFGCAPVGKCSRFLGFLTAAGPVLRTVLIGLWLCAAAICFWPGKSISFDISPRSLEPKNTPASIALQRMMDAFPATFEPMLLVVPLAENENAALLARRLEHRLNEFREAGLLRGFSGASLLLPQPEVEEANRSVLASRDWEELERSWAVAADAAGIRHGGDHPADVLLRSLQDAARSEYVSWDSRLPRDSPWWFFLDRMLSPDGKHFLIYARPSSNEAAAAVSAALRGEFPMVLTTGWSVMLRELQPWAWRELKIFGFGVTGLILVVLGLIYHSWRLWAIHVFLLGTSAIVIIAVLKLLDVRVNLLNVLAFPLILGVGVDYATHILLACRKREEAHRELNLVFKPVLLSGLTTLIGFGALTLAGNPALSGLGLVCLIGIGSCLFVTCLYAPILASRATSSPASPPPHSGQTPPCALFIVGWFRIFRCFCRRGCASESGWADPGIPISRECDAEETLRKSAAGEYGH